MFWICTFSICMYVYIYIYITYSIYYINTYTYIYTYNYITVYIYIYIYINYTTVCVYIFDICVYIYIHIHVHSQISLYGVLSPYHSSLFIHAQETHPTCTTVDDGRAVLWPGASAKWNEFRPSFPMETSTGLGESVFFFGKNLWREMKGLFKDMCVCAFFLGNFYEYLDQSKLTSS